jgi:hypothetical protein
MRTTDMFDFGSPTPSSTFPIKTGLKARGSPTMIRMPL